MAISVVMPALEMAQETGKLVAWRKKEGDSVAKGEPLLEIETDKAVMEIEAPGDGVLAGVMAAEGAVVPVGQTIAWIVRPGEAPPAQPEKLEPARQATREAARASAPAIAPSVPALESGGKVSPKARRFAREHGIDLTRVRGSGPDGAILFEDVQAASQTGATTAAPAKTEALSSVARLMAERTTQSWTTVPHFFLVRDVDAGALNHAREKLRAGIEKSHGVRLSHTDLLVALVARVLAKHPRLNSSWTGSGIREHKEINIAVAIAVEDGVVAAVIPNAATSTLSEIAVQRRELADRARAGKLRPADISGATFTISNLGMYNVDAFTAIISPPQAAILALGRIAQRVVPVEGHPGVRPVLTMTLSCDHRVAGGAQAAAFLDDLANAIANPEKWLQE
jgi:pyruvate dehydrogenase E2 component (dihydrolipoamide acetyltransferase)